MDPQSEVWEGSEMSLWNKYKPIEFACSNIQRDKSELKNTSEDCLRLLIRFSQITETKASEVSLNALSVLIVWLFDHI